MTEGGFFLVIRVFFFEKRNKDAVDNYAAEAMDFGPSTNSEHKVITSMHCQKHMLPLTKMTIIFKSSTFPLLGFWATSPKFIPEVFLLSHNNDWDPFGEDYNLLYCCSLRTR